MAFLLNLSPVVAAPVAAAVAGAGFYIAAPGFKAPSDEELSSGDNGPLTYTRAEDGAQIVIVSGQYLGRHGQPDKALQEVIRDLQPDTVVLQTDPAQQASLGDEYYPDAGSVWGQVNGFSKYWVESARERFSELGLQLNHGPKTARDAAEEAGATVVIQDRPEEITFAHLPWWRVLGVGQRFLAGKEWVGKRTEDMATYDRAWYVGDRPSMRRGLVEFADIDAKFPGLTKAVLGDFVYRKWVEEPAQYFAAKLNKPSTAPGQKIVAVTSSTASKNAVRQALDENVNYNTLVQGPNYVTANIGLLSMIGLGVGIAAAFRAGQRPTGYWFKHVFERANVTRPAMLRDLEKAHPSLKKSA